MEETKTISDSYNQFAFNLYKKLNEQPGQNVFMSPFSIVSALSMFYAGARENTEKQLKEILSISHLTNDDIHKLNSELLSHLKSLQTENAQLNIANKLYPNHDFDLSEEYVDLLQSFYWSNAVSLDYSNAEESANIINKWVEDETKGKVKNLIDKDAISEGICLILINAIYFKGNWLNKFDKNLTVKEKFYLSDSETVDVEMMKLFDKTFNIKINPFGLPAKFCEIPYIGEKVSMTIILPNQGVHISELESKLDANVLKSIFDLGYSRDKAHIFIPKFKLEKTYELSNELSDMGAADAFDSDKADFSGIDGNGGIHISKVIHKAVFEINEEGSEAAASTGVMMVLTSSALVEYPPEEFNCNRPFIFIIHENAGNTILFMGKYANPNL